MLALVCCFAVLAKAQTAVTRETAHSKAVKDFEAAMQAAFKGDDNYAIKYLEAAIKREPNFADALVELAGIYYNSGNFARAEMYLERVAAFEGAAGSNALYGLAMAELKQEKFTEATTHLDAYLAHAKPRADRKDAAERYRNEAIFKAKALAQPIDFKLERLPPAINSPADAEYLPALTADGNTLVFTRRVGNRQEDFYMSQRINGEWQPAVALHNVNTLENEGAQTMSADGKYLIFTGCNRPDGLGSCDLYYSTFTRGEWSEPKNLGAPVNSKAWESQPSLAANGNLLFFASRRPGGQGKADLYASGRTADGGWTEPMNLGPIINTPEDDQAPFFHSDGQTLYFMSTGHPGMGNFDLFVTKLGSDNVWSTPQNLGYPINTESNEGAIAVAIDGRTAYYATDVDAIIDSIDVGSRRSGTTDLFTFTLPQNVRAGVVTYVRARVVDAETRRPVAAAALFTDASTDKPYLKRRAAAEDGEFLAVLPSGKTYTLAVEEPGYLFYSDRFELTEPASATQPFELLIELQPVPAAAASTAPAKPSAEPIVLRNVLFETASAELLPSSREELDRLQKLLSDNPSLRIRIQGHTDDVGSPADNLELSQRRARAVLEYLVAAGIDASRLESAGFGESKPLLENRDEQSRALNRRTEFVVL